MSRLYVVCTRFITIVSNLQHVIDYFKHDEITGIIDELCTIELIGATFICILLFSVIPFILCCML